MTKRDERHHDNGSLLWRTREQLAKRSPIDAASIAFDAARKRVKKIRDQSEQDLLWRKLADLLDGFPGPSDGDSP